jgi:hypothetical protein
MIEAKRKQHHVWKYYLKAWSIDQKIWVSQNGKCFNTSLENIANERDFYELKELSDHEVSYIRTIIDGFHPLLQESANGWLETFTATFKKKSNLDKWLQEKFGFTTFINTGNEEDVLFKNLAINFEEELHCLYEKSAKPLLDRLLQKDPSVFLNFDDKLSFIQFMSIQYFRTKALKQNVIEAVKHVPSNYAVNIEKMWNVLSHIYAGNLASNLIANEQFRFVILENATDTELITGDQPIINTFAAGINRPPIDTEFYYPISPKLAVLLTKSASYLSTNHNLTFEDVHKYNKSMIEKSNLQIFSSLQNSLALYFTN